jgi:hypothetical protein
MEMKEYFIGLAFGSVVTFVAAKLLGLFKRYEPVVVAKLQGLDEAIEKLLNIDIPDRWQAVYHAIITGAVAYVEKYALTAEFWRRVVRFVATFDKSKGDALMLEISNIDWESKFMETLSPELKTVVNTIKADLAEKTAVAKVVTAMPAESRPTAATIRTQISVVASGIKLQDEAPVTAEKMQRVLEETRERVAKLRESQAKAG